MANFTRNGYGQVEPNLLQFQRTGAMLAQLPAADAITQLENGQFAKYDYANNEVNFTGSGEWMLVYNEIKLYDDAWRETYKDFAMIKSNYTPGSDIYHVRYAGPFKGTMYPRLCQTYVGDIFTTNCLVSAGAKNTVTTMGDLTAFVKGTTLGINTNGFLDPAGTKTDMTWQIVGEDAGDWKLPDGQDAVKVMRIK